MGDSALLKYPDELFSKDAFYQWHTPRLIITRTKQLYVKQKGVYSIKVVDGTRTYYDTTYVKAVEKPFIRIRDTTFCSGQQLVLNTPKNKLYSYLWSNGDKSPTTKIEKPGKYWLKVNYKGCQFTDTFKVNNAAGVIPNFGKEYLICESDQNKVLSVKAPNGVKLFWNTGANSNNISPTKEGVYWLKSISKTCGTKTDSVIVKFKNCDCDIFVPNSFTPNEDDRNDYFIPQFQCEYSFYILTILDRWGNTVYTSSNVNLKWDGRFKGNPCPDDVYVYHIEAIEKKTDKKISRNGHISLFR